MVRTTSARPSGGRPEVPAKMTSSIFPPRSDFAPCSPMTHAKASTTFDFPDPLGPTTHVIPGSKPRVVAEAKDLNPRRVSVFRYTGERLPRVVGLGDLAARWQPTVVAIGSCQSTDGTRAFPRGTREKGSRAGRAKEAKARDTPCTGT